VPFTLAAEGALTSALAAPLLLIMLEFLGFDDSGSGALGTHLLLSAWSVAGGAVVGWLVGTLMMRWLALLDPDRQGDLLEDMIVVATAVLTYVGALALRTDGLIAVFIAGLALSHGGRLGTLCVNPRERASPAFRRPYRALRRSARHGG